MAKRPPTKPFQWCEANHEWGYDPTDFMRTDLGHVFYAQLESMDQDHKGEPGMDYVRFPDGTARAIPRSEDRHAVAEKDYMENVRPKEELYAKNLEKGILTPCFDSSDWDHVMEADAARIAESGREPLILLSDGRTQGWSAAKDLYLRYLQGIKGFRERTGSGYRSAAIELTGLMDLDRGNRATDAAKLAFGVDASPDCEEARLP